MPDEPIASDPVVDDLVHAVEPAAAAVEPAVTLEPEADAEPAADPAPQPAPASPTMPKWGWERLSEETNRRQSAEERERLATERANALEEITRRLQAAPKDGDPVIQVQRQQPVAQPAISDVEQAAARIVFQRDVQTVIEKGVQAYGPRWADAVNILDACKAATPEFVASVMEIEPAKAHGILFQIAQDGERAVALANMTPTRRAAEIKGMIMAQAAAEPKVIDLKPADPKPEPKAPVSRAPAPKPSIAPHAAAPDIDPTTPEGNEKMDDKQFEAWYKAKYLKRSA